MNFANAMYREGSTKRTENGAFAFAYDSTAQGAQWRVCSDFRSRS